MSHTRDPETEYRDPRNLLGDESLTAEEKLKVLESWQMDLIEDLRAEEENMPSEQADTGATAKKLADVNEAIARLQGDADENDPGGSVEEPVREPPRKPYRPFRDVPKPQPIDNPDPPKPDGQTD